MAELKRYLYDGLSFKISTGIVPVVVNGVVIDSKQSVPQVEWNLNFGKVDVGLKNAIEDTIMLDPNDTFINSFIGPHFYIGKRINPVGDVAEYYLTYAFEYKYYNTFVNKPLSYVVDGSDHLIDGGIRIPISQVDTDTPVEITGAISIYRKLFYLASVQDVNHEFNNIFSMKAKFIELAAPLAYTGMFKVGESRVDNNLYC